MLIPEVTQKPWGHERILAKTDKYVVKEIFVKQGHRLSEQYHKKKVETMFLIYGTAWLLVGAVGSNMTPLLPVYIPAKTIHRLAGVTDCLIVEVSSTQLDDVVRISDDYDR
jgi:mannose-6-phosphate isomerase-like protein (cupin superfamily)